MGIISLVIPQIGQPDTTEDVKVQNAFTTIQAVINGNIDTNNLNTSAGVKDTQLASPNNAAKRLLMTQNAVILNNTSYTTGSYGWLTSGVGSNPVLSGASGGATAPALWFPDPSLAIAGKTAQGVARLTIVTNGTAPAASFNLGITPITASSGGANTMVLTFGAPSLATASIASPGGGVATSADSGAFTLPTSGTAPYIFVLAITGTSPTATNAFMGITMSLYSLNA